MLRRSFLQAIPVLPLVTEPILLPEAIFNAKWTGTHWCVGWSLKATAPEKVLALAFLRQLKG